MLKISGIEKVISENGSVWRKISEKKAAIMKAIMKANIGEKRKRIGENNGEKRRQRRQRQRIAGEKNGVRREIIMKRKS